MCWTSVALSLSGPSKPKTAYTLKCLKTFQSPNPELACCFSLRFLARQALGIFSTVSPYQAQEGQILRMFFRGLYKYLLKDPKRMKQKQSLCDP